MLEALQNTPLALWVTTSPSIFAYTTILTLHAIGLAIVVGVNTLIALRLLGYANGIPLTSLRRLYGTVYFGFTINLVSGVLLFIGEATAMAAMVTFWGKLTFVFIGMIVGQILRVTYFNDTASIEAGVVTPKARRLAYLSLGCWYLALIIGRLTGYPDMVNAWFGLNGAGSL